MPPRNGPERFSGEWWNTYTEVDTTTGCINWTGTRCREGRGRTWYKGRGGVPVYRVVYEQCYGDVPPSLKVCHTCDNPSCVNPYHLFVGTQKDNLRDMFAKGRARPQGVVPGSQSVRALDLFHSGMKRDDIATAMDLSVSRVNQMLKDAGFVKRRRRTTPTLAAAVSLGELASQNFNENVATAARIHLIGPKETPKDGATGWRTVLGVPPVQPTQALQLWQDCHPLRTGNQQPNRVLARCCRDAGLSAVLADGAAVVAGPRSGRWADV